MCPSATGRRRLVSSARVWWTPGDRGRLTSLAHNLLNEPPTCAIGGWQARDKQHLAQCDEIVLGHQRSISHVDRRRGAHAMLRQQLRHLRQDGRVDGLVGGLAIFRVAKVS